MADAENNQGTGVVKCGRRTSIPCPHCGGRKSYGKAGSSTDERVYRRRQCVECNQRFTTYEASANDYKTLERARYLEVERAGFREGVAKWTAETDKRIDSLKQVFAILKQEEEKIAADRIWQAENPIEALRAITPRAGV